MPITSSKEDKPKTELPDGMDESLQEELDRRLRVPGYGEVFRRVDNRI